MKMEKPSRRIVAQPLPAAEPAERAVRPAPAAPADAEHAERREVGASA